MTEPMSSLNPKAKCWDCGKFFQYKYVDNKKIPRRSEKTVCQCPRGVKARNLMDKAIAAKRKHTYLKKKIARWQAHKDNPPRDRMIAIVKAAEKRHIEKMKIATPQQIRHEEDKAILRKEREEIGD